jgi:hypothetical protein
MITKRARAILSALVEGVDPHTGQEIDNNDPLLLRAEVIRALLAGVTALDEKSAREAHRASLPANVRKPWTADEERQLVTEFQRGDVLTDIAQSLGRTLRAIESRLERLGLLSAQDRTTSVPYRSET